MFDLPCLITHSYCMVAFLYGLLDLFLYTLPNKESRCNRCIRRFIPYYILFLCSHISYISWCFLCISNSPLCFINSDLVPLCHELLAFFRYFLLLLLLVSSSGSRFILSFDISVCLDLHIPTVLHHFCISKSPEYIHQSKMFLSLDISHSLISNNSVLFFWSSRQKFLYYLFEFL